jgi:hypothetical protein
LNRSKPLDFCGPVGKERSGRDQQAGLYFALALALQDEWQGENLDGFA